LVLEVVYTPKEVAEILKVSEQVIADELKMGRLEGFKVGRQWRITEGSLRSYIQINTIKPTTEIAE
jgi:excisionase family DNA binding protein